MKTLICLILALLPLTSSAQFSPDPNGVHFLKMVLSDDYRKALDGGLTGIDWHIPKSEEKITAFALSKAFRDDPESAASRFNGKWITVGGSVTTVGVGKDGKPFIEYGVSNESIQNVRATFDTTSDFLRGQVDWVICKSAGVRGGAPLLEHCIFKYPTTERGFITPEIDYAVNQWFKNGTAPWFAQNGKTKALLFVFYWSERKLIPNSDCNTYPSGEACVTAFDYVIKNLNAYPDFGQAYRSAKDALGLPDLPPHATTK